MSKTKHKLFDDLGGGLYYMPSSVAGCVILFAEILLMLGIIGLGQLASRFFDSQIPAAISFIIVAALFIAFMRFARRNS